MDILVSDEEMAELDNIRPLWQEGGMSCPADGCDVFLQCMTKCRKHWSEIHTEFVFGYQCILCRFATMRRNQIIRHMGRVHPTSRPGPGAEDLFKRIQGKALCQFCEISDSRRQFRDQETKRRRSLVAGIEIPLVKEIPTPATKWCSHTTQRP